MTDSDGPMLDLLATCTFGLEAVVARELEQLGYDAKPIATGRVLFRGDFRAIAEANTWLRSADRVLLRVGTFEVSGGDRGFDLLFDGVKSLAWEKFLAQSAAILVSGRCVRSQISSEPAAQRATKRAIVDRLQHAYATNDLPGLLPETGPRVQIEVAIVKDVATLTIDTSGAGLHKRGYRSGLVGEAALKETLAAGIVQLSVWRSGRALVDPFCGSGTIAIEAAMLARSIAPGLNRTFDAEFWLKPKSAYSSAADQPLIDPKIWSDVRDEARASVVPERLDPPIHASDIDDRALALARASAKAAGVERDIHFLKRDARDLDTKLDFGVIITNPPYGVRLNADDMRELDALYRALPSTFRRLPTWSFSIFTGRLDLERLFGQVATRRRKLYNSTIECTLFTFLGPKPRGPHRNEPEEILADEPELTALEDSGPPDERPESEPELPTVAVEPGSVESTEPAPPPPSTPTLPTPPPTATPAPVAPPKRTERNTPHHSAPPSPVFGGLRERDEREAQEFARCLQNNLRHLRKFPARGIHCYRVYERDVPDVPLIVDRYHDYFHVAEYERAHSRTAAQQADWFDRMRRAIADTAGVPTDHVIMKEKHRQRGTSQHEKLDDAGRTMTVLEGSPPLKFEVNLTDYIDTGLFLDHRQTRQMVREQAAGKRVLNLFCYTGSFTVYAASGGCTSSVSVDLSNTYLAWAKRNMQLNALFSPAHRAVCADVMEFLREHPKPGPEGAYDLVITDPPTFSNSKSLQDDWEVGMKHAEMLQLLVPLLSPQASVFFSNNYRRFKLDESAVAAAGLSIREITSRTIPAEYRNRRIHRCWKFVNVGVDAAVEQLRQQRERSALKAAAAGLTPSDSTPPDDDDPLDSPENQPY